MTKNTRAKFDETDRRAVIRVLEEELDICLSRVGRRRKWLRDEEGRDFWVIGGYDEWHGIPEEMMDACIDKSCDGVLVFAKRERGALRIFTGPLEPVIRNRRKLYRAHRSSGDYQFTVAQRGDRIHIKQIPGATLRRLTSSPYAEHDKAKDQKMAELRKLFDQLSPDERRHLMQSCAEASVALVGFDVRLPATR